MTETYFLPLIALHGSYFRCLIDRLFAHHEISIFYQSNLSPKASPESQPMNLTSGEYWQPTDLTFSFSSRVTHNFFFILDISLGNEHQNFF